MINEAPPRLPAGFRLLRYDRLASTNDEAKRLAREGAASGAVLWTQEQTAGRGRRGRSWVSVPGNLYVSFLLRPVAPAAVTAQLGFVAALAVGAAVLPLLPDPATLRYKWPNDILLGEAKLVGILLESEIAGSGALDWVVIGIGVNVAGHPQGLDYAATSLAAAGCKIEAGALLERLAAEFAAGLERWQQGGFAPVREAWLARAAGLGALRTTGTVTGRFVDLDGDGALLLDTASGRQRIVAGDVVPAG